MSYNFITLLTTFLIITQITRCICKKLILIFLKKIFLVFQACCENGLCRSFDSLEAMYGSACCGDDLMNMVDQICCDDVIRDRSVGNVYAERCCGNQTITNTQTCCSDNVFDVQNGLCCGEIAFAYSSTTKCCDNVLYENTNTTSECCGSSIYDSSLDQMCCGKQVYNMTEYDSCCRSNTPDSVYFPYNSKTHECCSIPISTFSTSKCCYLRQNGTTIPTVYNSTIECCKYPYETIGNIVNNSCEFA